MNRGTKEGTEEEKYFCEQFNRGKINLENTDLQRSSNTFAVHCVKHQYSSLSERKVKPKSDCFLIKDLNNNFKRDKTSYISESELNPGTFEHIKYSGISVKNKASKKYQIHKFGFDTFNKIFPEKELFVGIIIYCKNDTELHKNTRIFNYVGIDEKEFLLSFSNCFENSDDKKAKLKKIKTKCIAILQNRITTNRKIWDIVFSGKGCFEDPFYATYFYQNDLIIKINENNFPHFSITNGSGRSRGNYTVVVKP